MILFSRCQPRPPLPPQQPPPPGPRPNGRRSPPFSSSSFGWSSPGRRAVPPRSASAPKPPTPPTSCAPSAPPTPRSSSNASPAACSASARSRQKSSAALPTWPETRSANPWARPHPRAPRPHSSHPASCQRTSISSWPSRPSRAPPHRSAPPAHPYPISVRKSPNGAEPSSHTEGHGRPRRADSPPPRFPRSGVKPTA
jgi:hypothetical protein